MGHRDRERVGDGERADEEGDGAEDEQDRLEHTDGGAEIILFLRGSVRARDDVGVADGDTDAAGQFVGRHRVAPDEDLCSRADVAEALFGGVDGEERERRVRRARDAVE